MPQEESLCELEKGALSVWVGDGRGSMGAWLGDLTVFSCKGDDKDALLEDRATWAMVTVMPSGATQKKLLMASFITTSYLFIYYLFICIL